MPMIENTLAAARKSGARMPDLGETFARLADREAELVTPTHSNRLRGARRSASAFPQTIACL